MTDKAEEPRHLTEASLRSVLKSLRDFGYNGLALAEVREASDNVLAGKEPDGIIEMFIAGMLRDAGELA